MCIRLRTRISICTCMHMHIPLVRTHSYVWDASFICVACLIHVCASDRIHLYMWHVLFIHVSRLIQTCDTTLSCVRHDSFKHMAWLIYICGMLHEYMWHGSFIWKTWLIDTCGVIHSCMWHDLFMHTSSLPTLLLARAMTAAGSSCLKKTTYIQRTKILPPEFGKLSITGFSAVNLCCRR